MKRVQLTTNFYKRVQGYWSLDLATCHKEAFEMLNDIDSPLLLELYAYSNDHYVAKNWSGKTLGEWWWDNRSPEWAYKFMNDMHNLYYEFSKRTLVQDGVTYRLSYVDMHPGNVLVNQHGVPKVIDYDSIGWVREKNITYYQAKATYAISHFLELE
jgi:hypothetical protein